MYQLQSLTSLLGYLITTGCTGTPGIKAPEGGTVTHSMNKNMAAVISNSTWMNVYLKVCDFTKLRSTSSHITLHTVTTSQGKAQTASHSEWMELCNIQRPSCCVASLLSGHSACELEMLDVLKATDLRVLINRCLVFWFSFYFRCHYYNLLH